MDIAATIKNYLPQIMHMSLATSRDNRPWVCEVHYVYDDDLSLYFRSTPAARHSLEIADNPHCAGNMVTQHHRSQAVRGVYFEGLAELMSGVDEHHIAYKLYCDRFGTGPEILAEQGTATGHGFYKISVTDFYLFDSYESHPSRKYHLPWGT